MARVTISPKFQIVIPKEIRERLDLKPGQQVAMIDRDGFIAVVPQRPLSELRGIAKGAPTDDYRDETDRF
ncbi:MAG TPA: AbrB/MazE/SpoVT family DNA-binding domain-containing protein [Thermoleophilia bacterium]